MSSDLEWQDIRDTVRLDEVIAALELDFAYLKKGEHFCHCPLDSHPGADASPSFSINEDSLLWNCFTCDDGGHLPTLVRRLKGGSWGDAVQWLAQYSDGSVADDDDGFLRQLDTILSTPPRRPRIRSEATSGRTLPIFPPRVIHGLPEAPVALCEKWGLDEDTIHEFGIRYDEKAERDGYVGPGLIIPHIWDGRLVGWQTRWLGERPKRLPKYTNTDDFPKGLTLFGYHRALGYGKCKPVLVESPMTVMRLWQLRIPAVASFGASITDEQLELLRAFRHGLIIAFDNDPPYRNSKGEWVIGAGPKAIRKVYEALDELIPLWIAPMAEGNKADLADMPDEKIRDILSRSIPAFEETFVRLDA